MTTAKTIFPQNPVAPKKGTLPLHLWPQSVRQDVDRIRRWVKTLQRIASIAAHHPEDSCLIPPPHDALWSEVNTLVPLRTDLSSPPMDLTSLTILHKEDLKAGYDAPPSQLQTTFKGLRRVTRILILQACKLRRARYGKTLLRLRIKKSSVALKSILCTTEGTADASYLPTNFSLLRDETTGHLITVPEELIAKITEMETVVVSLDPTLPPGPLSTG